MTDVSASCGAFDLQSVAVVLVEPLQTNNLISLIPGGRTDLPLDEEEVNGEPDRSSPIRVSAELA